MAAQLSGKRIAFLVANEGVEQVELTEPWQAVEEAGGQPVLVAPETDTVQAFNHIDKADTFTPSTARSARPRRPTSTALVLPGGVANPDKLRIDEDAVAFVRPSSTAGKPIAAICHGPWTLVEAGLVAGKTLTQLAEPADRHPQRRRRVARRGGVTCRRGFTLVTSRKPDDLERSTRRWSRPSPADRAGAAGRRWFSHRRPARRRVGSAGLSLGVQLEHRAGRVYTRRSGRTGSSLPA